MSYDQENQKIKNLSFITNDHLLNLVLDENSEFNSQKNCNYNNIQQEIDEDQWIYGQNFNSQFQQHQENPFYDSYIHNNQEQYSRVNPIAQQCQNSDMYGSNKKMEENGKNKILEENQDLFKINQAKSLMNDSVNQSSSQKKTKKRQDKTNKQFQQFDSDSEDSQSKKILEENKEKNRIAAQNSRKRKKVYVELLEAKVGELTSQLKNLRNLCQTQQEFIDQYANQEMYMKYKQLKEEWKNQIEQIISKKGEEEEINISLIENELSKFDGLKNEKQQIIVNLLQQNKIIPFPINYLVQTQDQNHYKYLKRQQNYPQFQSILDQINKKQAELLYIYDKLKVLQNSLMDQFKKLIGQSDQKSLIRIFYLFLESMDKSEKNMVEQSYQVSNELQKKIIKT